MLGPLQNVCQTVLKLLTAVVLLGGRQGASAAESLDVQLEYHEVDFSIQNIYIRSEVVTNANRTFSKLPADATANCQYMNLVIGQHKIGIAWDPKVNQLWLDQNRNLDFSDDAEGRYTPATNQTAFSLSRGNRTPNFPKLRLALPPTKGVDQYCIGLALGRYYDELKSFYEGHLEIAEKEWQVGWIHNPVDQRYPKGFLLLRPWSERTNFFVAKTWSTETFPLPETVFLEGKNYRVELASKPSNSSAALILRFTEVSGPIGELTIQGESLERVVLLGDKGQVIPLGKPFRPTTVPAGTYTRTVVLLKAGSAEAEGSFEEPLIIQPGATNHLPLGGPLTNLVTVERQGRQLNLNYKLAGVGGKKYQIVRKGNPEPPRFDIYQGDRRLATGKFEFG